MNTTQDNTPTDRPLDVWARAVDRLISHEIATALEPEGLTRRDAMVLGALAGTVQMPADMRERMLHGKRLRALARRGWVAEVDGEWALTDDGRETAARVEAIIQGVRARVVGAVSPEQYAATVDALEAIAGEFGGIEGLRAARRDGRGRRGGRGFGRHGHGFGGHGHGFGGHGHGFGRHGHGFGRHGDGGSHGHGDSHGHGHGHGENHGCGHGHGHGGAFAAERSYERGFEAGFAAAQRGGEPAASDAA